MVVDNKRFKDCCIQKHGMLVVRHYWLREGSPDFSTNLNGGLTGVYYRDEILEAFVHLYVATWASPLCLWTKTPFPPALLSKSTLNAKGIETLD